jgi:hypothetical protein
MFSKLNICLAWLSFNFCKRSSSFTFSLISAKLDIKPCVSVTPHINNNDYVGRPLDIKPCASVTPHIDNHDYVGRPLDSKPCVSVTPHIDNHDYMETEIEKENYTFMKEYLPEIREKVNECY